MPSLTKEEVVAQRIAITDEIAKLTDTLRDLQTQCRHPEAIGMITSDTVRSQAIAISCPDCGKNWALSSADKGFQEFPRDRIANLKRYKQ